MIWHDQLWKGSVMNAGRAGLRVIVLHGAHGGPDTNCFPWLRTELVAQGIEVLLPRLPTPEGQSLQTWFDAYGRVVTAVLPAPTILVGHSLGAAFALRVVEKAAEPFEGVFLAAGFIGALGLPDYDPINQSIFSLPFDWAGIRERRGRVCRCWAEDDDPYVPLSRSQDVADTLNASLDVLPRGGHLNSETGFNAFPQLREAILAVRVSRQAE